MNDLTLIILQPAQILAPKETYLYKRMNNRNDKYSSKHKILFLIFNTLKWQLVSQSKNNNVLWHT